MVTPSEPDERQVTVQPARPAPQTPDAGAGLVVATRPEIEKLIGSESDRCADRGPQPQKRVGWQDAMPQASKRRTAHFRRAYAV